MRAGDWGDAAGWVNLVDYADDLMLLAMSEDEPVSMYLDLPTACARFGLGFRPDNFELWSSPRGRSGD